jgi:multisubunit Na+/H+ antiporter MnhG subunit
LPNNIVDAADLEAAQTILDRLKGTFNDLQEPRKCDVLYATASFVALVICEEKVPVSIAASLLTDFTNALQLAMVQLLTTSISELVT